MTLIKHILNLIFFSFGKIKPITGPIRVHWDITELCNSRCKHCTRWKIKNSKTDLNYKECCSIIKELKNNGVMSISFSGNEPLIRKDIYNIIKYASDLKIFTSINTNGLLLNEENAEKMLKNGLGSIIFSLDSCNEKDHDEFRGVPDSFKKIFKSVEILKNIRQKLRKKIDIQVTSVANKRNLHQIYDIVKLCKEKGFDKIILQPIHNIKIYFESEQSLLLKPEDIPVLERQLKKIKKDFKDFVVVPDKYLEEFKTFIKNPKKLYKYRCAALFMICDIRSDGNIVPCPVGFKKIGNLKDKSFREIWYSEEANKLREDIKKNKHPMCWFSCIQPINIMANDIKKFNLHNLINLNFIKHILSKIK